MFPVDNAARMLYGAPMPNLSRWTELLSVRLDPKLNRKIRAGVKRLQPPMTVAEWARDVLRKAAEELPEVKTIPPR